ncbi:31800_t:CDS:2, partial [Racocetra persica]
VELRLEVSCSIKGIELRPEVSCGVRGVELKLKVSCSVKEMSSSSENDGEEEFDGTIALINTSSGNRSDKIKELLDNLSTKNVVKGQIYSFQNRFLHVPKP